MKRITFNLGFTIIFTLTFFLLINTFSNVLVQALPTEEAPKPKPFLPGESLHISSCQKWSSHIRDFKVKDGEEAKQITILLYHRIIDDSAIKDIHYTKEGELYPTIVLKSEFKKQMQYLKDQGYTTLTNEELKLFIQNRHKIPKKSIVITFDDGFKDNYEEAYPILKKHEFTALNFVIASYITKNTMEYKEGEVQYFSASDIKNSCDVFEFQSHTYNLHKRTKEGVAFLVDRDQQQIKEDLKTSIEVIRPVRPTFAYPYGEYDKEARNALKQLNIGMAFTSEFKDTGPNISMLEIPRKPVYPTDTIEDFKKKIK
ncbi:peptidoglycan/xylan/chitin deacetylase (PgdA/CDA1 family) [Peribacillus deserti]|uniref:Peptidoglycan/xylan/chitin deacetylase (PgdA/CDA1 family) n=1 Tax=Peribacillus deserti TaxID=673318 RepID=A0ABS2QDA3_9BACI|nr:polysaccharide deacetylase family protein [Peribacillus deserti]MBM7690794.1 peptidoglycan/xylan/chitin deacetylase (PgdA/CDA1 family) [Peribacillus deserti]